MTPQELRNSILQLAIQGKLVEQRPEEGTAEELYREIQREKQRLVKEGKIKKEKPLSEIKEDEIPFEIPDSWKWVRLGDLCTDVFSGKSPVYSKTPTVYKIIGQAANQQDRIDLNCIKYTNESFWNAMEERFFLIENDVLLNTLGNGTLGRSGIFQNISEKLLTDGHLFVFRHLYPITSKYFYYYLQHRQKEIIKTANGSTNQTFLSLRNCLRWIVPLPPLSEQKRIVAKIEELLPYVERYEEAWNRLGELDKRFPGDLQKSVLQLAIQGKLVEQRPDEGTAEELYREIQREKQRLVKEGKIKKEKPLPEIKEDEIPFEIPDSWKWVRLREVFSVGTGMTPLKSESKFYEKGNIPWVNSSLTNKRYIDHVDTCVTDYALEKTSLILYPPHTLIVAMYGQGKTRGQTSELLISATINQACASLQNIVYYPCFVTYVYFFFQYNYDLLRKKAEGTSQPNLNLRKIKETIIPLPPLSEQKRIVAKLEELTPLCKVLAQINGQS